LTAALLLIRELQIEIELLKNGRRSKTSSTPSSQDYTKGHNNNLRVKTGKKSGGQKGHKGSTLKMSESPDETQKHYPEYCKHCGEEFSSNSKFELDKRKQEVVIPPIKAKIIEHQSFSCTCEKCGRETISDLPAYLKSKIQYGKNIQSLITYLSVYQYLPSNRIKKLFEDILNIPISEGTIYNILEAMGNKALPSYNVIKEKVENSKVVGGDETGIKINGKKAWLWVFQNSLYTYLKASFSRGYTSVSETFTNGFPQSVYVSDSLPAQLKIKTKSKQLCLSHLIRELNNFEDALKSDWATKLKQLLQESISYKKQMSVKDYKPNNPKIKSFENQLTELLDIDYSGKHKKLQAFVKRLQKHRHSILTFLYHLEVPPDNNGSERAIRNAKIKMKVSWQFKSFEFAEYYAIIRSVVDTTIKKSQNVFEALSSLSDQNVLVAE